MGNALPGRGVCGGSKMFGSALLQPARIVCVSSGRFFIVKSDQRWWAIAFSDSLPLYLLYECICTLRVMLLGTKDRNSQTENCGHWEFLEGIRPRACSSACVFGYLQISIQGASSYGRTSGQLLKNLVFLLSLEIDPCCSFGDVL